MNTKIKAALLGFSVLCGSAQADAGWQAATANSFSGPSLGYGAGYIYNSDTGAAHQYIASLGYNTWTDNQTTTWTAYVYNNGDPNNTQCGIWLTSIVDPSIVYSTNVAITSAVYAPVNISVNVKKAGTYTANLYCWLAPIEHGQQARIYFVY